MEPAQVKKMCNPHKGEDGNYISKKVSRSHLEFKNCPQCHEQLIVVYSEIFKFIEHAGILMTTGHKIHGLECKTCRCSHLNIPN